jgi:hypothetical protein
MKARLRLPSRRKGKQYGACGGKRWVQGVVSLAYLLFGVGAILILTLYVDEGKGDVRIALYHGFKGPSGAYVVREADFYAAWMAAVPLFTGFVLHAAIAIWFDVYQKHIRAGSNPWRWAEAIAGDGVYLFYIALLFGTSDAFNLFYGIFTLNAVNSWLGWQREFHTAREARERKKKTFDNEGERWLFLHPDHRWRLATSWLTYILLWGNLWFLFAEFLTFRQYGPFHGKHAVYWVIIGCFLQFLVHQVAHTVYLSRKDWIKYYSHIDTLYVITNLLFRPAVLYTILFDLQQT